MDIYHTIIRPIITEKSSHQARSGNEQRGGVYTFEVTQHANKAEVRDAVEKIYNVKVVDVRTQNREGKARRWKQFYGKKPMVKRAIVTVGKDSHIDLF